MTESIFFEYPYIYNYKYMKLYIYIYNKILIDNMF